MTKQKAYFVGIKGVGMTALALAMQDAGWDVMGSDVADTFITDQILETRRIKVLPLSATPAPDTTLMIYSGAYPAPDIAGIRALPLAQALAEHVASRTIIAVAGVGGKTTTTAMLASLFRAAGRDVGYYVGTGSIAGLAAPGASGTDPVFIVEADEYRIAQGDLRPKFSLLTPQVLITTNIVHDHPDVYPDEAATLQAFQTLLARLPAGGTWICNSRDPMTRRLMDLQAPALQGIHVVTYGPDHPLYRELELSVFGEQNQLDATAAVLAAIAVGLPESVAKDAIKAYQGAGRRQEFHGEVDGRLLYDDYGHHPGEIMVTVRAFREHFPDHRLLLVFEPHTYSRTTALLPEFAAALATADQTFLMPIFASAREQGTANPISSLTLAEQIPGARAVSWDDAASQIWAASQPGDIILTMGAGFVYKLHDEWKKRHANHPE